MVTVPEHPRYLLAKQFQNFHGMSVDQALSGHWSMPGTREVMPPEAHEEYWKPLYREKYRPWDEQVHEETSTHHAPEHLLKDWVMDHRTFLVGTNIPRIASKVRDLTTVMRDQGGTNENPIYRGSTITPPTEAAKDPGFPLSFTEDRYVANSFRAAGGSRAAIFKMAPHTARGVRLEDFGLNIRTVGQGRRKESEFLVDPTSIR